VPSLNPAVLDQLVKDLGGDEVTVRQIVGAYLAAMHERHQAVIDAVAVDNGQKIEASAHELASASLLVGAVDIAATAKAIEAAGKARELKRAASMLPVLEQAIIDVRKALSSW
jgi:HPt (histidine-containing phosphotransfer) domain-containing protein